VYSLAWHAWGVQLGMACVGCTAGHGMCGVYSLAWHAWGVQLGMACVGCTAWHGMRGMVMCDDTMEWPVE
jgi:hypothetical protein